ncbi:hypothetical protein [Mariniflexile sp. HMF6888]|uniref:hypothetical protein n=1 Tax=Mariniflexile sp. HMF6888 TaxID=3373086 RepID=UPI0037911139
MAKSNSFKLVKEVEVKNVEAYYMFINWVVDEFNLYLMNESEILKVYFPNGWFTISGFKT